MHVGCVMYLLNRTDCYMWIRCRGGARGVPGGALPQKNFAWPPSGPPKFSAWRHATELKSCTDHWQLPLLQNWPLQRAPQMKMSGSAPDQVKELVTVRVWNAPDQSSKVALQIKAMCTTHYTLCYRAISIIVQYKYSCFFWTILQFC